MAFNDSGFGGRSRSCGRSCDGFGGGFGGRGGTAHSTEMDGKLRSAVRKNDAKALQALVEAGADVNAPYWMGQTPLFCATRENSLAAAEVLIKAGADVTVCDYDGDSVLDLAESPEMRQLLTRAWPQDHPLWLHVLAKADLAGEVVDAVAAGADVDARDEDGQTPLFWASQKNSLAAAEGLIKAGADITIRDNDRRVTVRAGPGRRAMDCACLPEMRQLLARAWPQDHPLRLHVLAKARMTDEVADAVAAGADVDACDDEGRTPLFWAIMNGNLAAAEVLVEAGTNVTVYDNYELSALDWAESPELRQLLARAWPQDHPLWLHALAKADLADEVVEAVATGADVDARDELGRTPLFWSMKNDSLAAAKVLIDAGADVTIYDDNDQLVIGMASTPEMYQLLARAWPQDHPLRLHALAKADLADEVAEVAAAGADVNTCDCDDQTPLFCAVQNDSLVVATLLIENGADVTIRNDDGDSALDYAESPEMRQLLARAWPQDDPLRLHVLAKADLTDEVVDAVAAGADVNARDRQSRTPLVWAIQNDSLAAAEVLVEAGADGTIEDKYGWDALHWADSPEMYQLLARAWPQDHPHWLHALAKANQADEVVDAVAAGADVNARDEWSRTPLFWVIEKNSLAAAEALVDAGADVNARDEHGQTPLIWASMWNNLAAVEALVKAGADVTSCDNHGQSALGVANSPEMRQLLHRVCPQDDARQAAVTE